MARGRRAAHRWRTGRCPAGRHNSHAKGLPMLRTQAAAFLACSLLLGHLSPAAAQAGPSREEQMACRGDATRLCAEFVGKPQPMNACLKDNKAKLSDACRKVVEARGG
jgi:hypothetical protein